MAEDLGLERLVAAQHDDVRRDAHALQLLDRVLRGLGLVLVAAAQEGHERHVDEERVLLAPLQRDLPRRLQEGLALDVAGRAADLGDDHVRAGLFFQTVNEVLDLLRDVRDDLHLAGREVGKAVEVLVDEALVVPEVEVGLAAVLGHVDLAVLIGAHRPRIDVDIGVELLRRDLESAALEQPPQRGRRDPLAQTGHHAAGHKNIFRHVFSLRFAGKKILRRLKGALGPWLRRTHKNTIFKIKKA